MSDKNIEKRIGEYVYHLYCRRVCFSLTLALLLHRSGFEVQHSAAVLGFRRAELFPHLLGVIGVNLRIEAGAVPVALRIVQHRRDRVGHVDDPTRVAAHNKQETVGRFENQVLQLLIREEGRLVSVVRSGIPGACYTFCSDNICRKSEVGLIRNNPDISDLNLL